MPTALAVLKSGATTENWQLDVEHDPTKLAFESASVSVLTLPSIESLSELQASSSKIIASRFIVHLYPDFQV
jgi:hypothetical protein